MWTKGRKVTLAIVLVAALVGGALAWYFFAPKPEQERHEPSPGGELVKLGHFEDGETFHNANGTARLLALGDRYVLRFEDYDATSGPDVYFYLTPAPQATTSEEVEGQGVKLRTPTLMGQATLRGDFNLDIPEGVDVSKYEGVAVWCDTYNVLFGYAALTPA